MDIVILLAVAAALLWRPVLMLVEIIKDKDPAKDAEHWQAIKDHFAALKKVFVG